MPSIRGVCYVGLSVRDARKSSEWYRALLDLRVGYQEENDGWTSVLLEHASGLSIGLLEHRSNDGTRFSEFRTGLDHVEFEVESEQELNDWRSRLDELGIRHSGAFPHIVTFRDPDNIQLEFFWPGGMAGPAGPS
jgi:catechol 2,3-dioxygenase-like lactoylglutathione lyase family enzyme